MCLTGAAATWSRTASAKPWKRSAQSWLIRAMVAVARFTPKRSASRVGQTLLGQQLVVQQIEHEGADPRAVLHRRGDPFGEARPGLRAAGRATAVVRAVFGDDQRPRFGQIEHLPGDVAVAIAAVSAAPHSCRSADNGRWWRQVSRPARKRFTRMALLTAGLLARPFPQTADPRRLLQPVAGRWLAAVAAVQPEPALQFRDPCSQRRHLGGVARLLPKQQGNEVLLRELFKGGAIHRLLRVAAPESAIRTPAATVSSGRPSPADAGVPGGRGLLPR